MMLFSGPAELSGKAITFLVPSSVNAEYKCFGDSKDWRDSNEAAMPTTCGDAILLGQRNKVC